MLFFVKIIPNASKSVVTNDVVEFLEKEYVKVYVSSPPDDGKANAALLKLIAGYFGVAKSSVLIVSGEKSRYKQLEVKNVDWLKKV